MEREWSTYKTMAKDAGAPKSEIDTFNTDLSNLKKLVSEKKGYEASLAANKLTLATISFMDLYKPKVPVAVRKLDYYGRQVMLTSGHGDWDKAKTDSHSAITTWDTIKKRVEDINPDHAKSFSDIITKMSDAVAKKESNMVKKYSKKLLDEVNTLEFDFKK